MSAFIGILVGCLVTDVPQAQHKWCGTFLQWKRRFFSFPSFGSKTVRRSNGMRNLECHHWIPEAEQAILAEMPRYGQIFRLPTFMIIIGQGIFGTAPWFAFSYLTMWLELNCFANYQAAFIYTCFNLGTAVSSVLGGFLLDALCHRFPDHGPPAMAQSAAFLSIPLFGIIFFVLGSASGADVNHLISVYCFTFFVTGTLISWNMVVNNKMMSDVVPNKSYTYIYALDRAIEGTFGSLGQPCVGWLADHMFQYNPNRANTLKCSPSDATSLGQGVFSVCVSGCGVCFFLFSLAHCTYPRDRRRDWELGSSLQWVWGSRNLNPRAAQPEQMLTMVVFNVHAYATICLHNLASLLFVQMLCLRVARHWTVGLRFTVPKMVEFSAVGRPTPWAYRSAVNGKAVCKECNCVHSWVPFEGLSDTLCKWRWVPWKLLTGVSHSWSACCYFHVVLSKLYNANA